MRIASAALFGVITLVSASAFADPAVIIRERAKELSNQNNVRQGVAPPTQSPQPTVTPSGPPPITLSPALMRFNTDLATVRADSVLSAEQQVKMTQELQASALGAKPSLKSANKLVVDISAAFAEKPLSATSRSRFVQELDAVLNPGKYPQAKLEGILKDIQAIFQENGLARMKAMGIANDVQAIATEIQRGGG